MEGKEELGKCTCPKCGFYKISKGKLKDDGIINIIGESKRQWKSKELADGTKINMRIDTKENNQNVTKTYQINGISHLFAISGMHLSLFALIIKKLLEKLIKKETIISIVVILFFLFFSFLTNYTPSVLRALILYILLFIIIKKDINN